MIKCIRCEKEATFDSPELFCDKHWAEWWVEGYDATKEEAKKLEKETLKGIQNKYNKRKK